MGRLDVLTQVVLDVQQRHAVRRELPGAVLPGRLLRLRPRRGHLRRQALHHAERGRHVRQHRPQVPDRAAVGHHVQAPRRSRQGLHAGPDRHARLRRRAHRHRRRVRAGRGHPRAADHRRHRGGGLRRRARSADSARHGRQRPVVGQRHPQRVLLHHVAVVAHAQRLVRHVRRLVGRPDVRADVGAPDRVHPGPGRRVRVGRLHVHHAWRHARLDQERPRAGLRVEGRRRPQRVARRPRYRRHWPHHRVVVEGVRQQRRLLHRYRLRQLRVGQRLHVLGGQPAGCHRQRRDAGAAHGLGGHLGVGDAARRHERGLHLHLRRRQHHLRGRRRRRERDARGLLPDRLRLRQQGAVRGLRQVRVERSDRHVR
mmetsp:Transcript_43841/g.135349  ORF Transcript_43841/g.135349 Transcript_43841/m.135349 type:complete len:369 (+) Transcript_43841:1620-2726(+)